MLVSILIVIAIVGVLGAVVLVAAGRGGEMPITERTDYAPLDMGPVSATDVVLLRPPVALWGYTQQSVDEALDRIADSIRERDVRIVALEQLVTDLTRSTAPPIPLGSPYAGARHARAGADPAGPGNTGPFPAAGNAGSFAAPGSPGPGDTAAYPAPGDAAAFSPPGADGSLAGPGSTAQYPASGAAGSLAGPGNTGSFPTARDTGSFRAAGEPGPAGPGPDGATEGGPMGAPVTGRPQYPGQPQREAPPWATGTGWPPEISHD
ncbi:MAG TPA: hypothetical protein VH478_18770 [Trebonia sp.]|nr:hypothetical protein [Trebonia sp.]